MAGGFRQLQTTQQAKPSKRRAKAAADLKLQREQLDAVNASIKEAEAQLQQLSTIDSQIELRNSELAALEATTSDLRAEKESLESHIAGLHASALRLERENKKAGESLQKKLESTKELEVKASEARRLELASKNHVADLLSQDKQLNEQLTHKSKELHDLEQAIKRADKKLETRKTKEQLLSRIEKDITDKTSQLAGIKGELQKTNVLVDESRRQITENLDKARKEAQVLVNEVKDSIERREEALNIREGEVSRREVFLDKKANKMRQYRVVLEQKLGRRVDELEV